MPDNASVDVNENKNQVNIITANYIGVSKRSEIKMNEILEEKLMTLFQLLKFKVISLLILVV